jgi:hypothetical protein
MTAAPEAADTSAEAPETGAPADGAPVPGGPPQSTLDPDPAIPPAAVSGSRDRSRRDIVLRSLSLTWLPLLLVLAVAGFLRFWQLAAVGLNSDETVYAGTGASIGGDSILRSYFPIFRAHPVLVQLFIGLVMKIGHGDAAARTVPALCGVVTVALVYLLGRRLYGSTAGLVAALLLAVMPYHVVVSRQVLLDGPMTMFTTAALYCVVRYAESSTTAWMLAAGGSLGAAVLSKETSGVLLGAGYAFFALSRSVRVRGRDLAAGAVAALAVIAVSPLVLDLSGRAQTGQNYLLYQMFRRSNHPYSFYAQVLPGAIGWGVLAAAILGLVLLWRARSWRELLLVLWILVPAVFFTVWPVKGYQFLLPITPALVLLAGRTIVHLPALLLSRAPDRLPRRTAPAAVAVLALGLAVSLVLPAWGRVQPSTDRTFLAGTGGLPGGREAGLWVKGHAPRGAQLLAIGPSMANVLEYYGLHRVYALSVSPDPRNRNPAYVPVLNPDRALRNDQFQYLVWDSYTAARTPFYTAKLRALVQKYHGVAVFTATVDVSTGAGGDTPAPVIIIYQVRAS